MAERKKIAIVFWGYNTNWIGGTYYIINTIKGFNLLPNSEKPAIVVLSTNYSDFKELQKDTAYPFLSYSDYPKLNFFEKIINKAYRTLFNGRSLFIGNLKDIELFLYNPVLYTKKNKPAYWIPDFQEHYLPEMFPSEDIISRKSSQLKLSNSKHLIVFSSQNALNDFNKFYPLNRSQNKLIRFAVFHPQLDFKTHPELLVKYNITKPYFIVPNQFWKHKNHILVLKALALLKEKNQNLNFQIVFTGSTKDTRNAQHYDELLQYAETNQLLSDIRFLGFIPYNDMLILAKKSIALIQPSLFEGWSTVVEDGKSLNLSLILSDLEVHKEQTSNYDSHFFNPKSEKELSKLINKFIEHPLTPPDFNYEECQLQFANGLKKLIINEPAIP